MEANSLVGERNIAAAGTSVLRGRNGRWEGKEWDQVLLAEARKGSC